MTEGFQLVTAPDGVTYLTCDGLTAPHGFSTRLGGESEDFCRSSCTCSVRLTEKQITVEEATALGNGTASPEVQARLPAITRQCSN